MKGFFLFVALGALLVAGCGAPAPRVSAGRGSGQPNPDAAGMSEGTDSTSMMNGDAGDAPLCVPGSSQACTGPMGCIGFQVCNAAGSGYEPCDCGMSTTDGGVSPSADAHLQDAMAHLDASSVPMCTMDSECSPPTRVCENQQCVLGCGEFGGLSCSSNEVCDTNTGRCVVVNGPCTMDSECAPPQSVCEQGQCVGGCAVPGGIQCSGGLVCDMNSGRCVMGGPICHDDTDCMPPSTICNLNTGQCDPGCGSTGCPPTEMCNTATGHCETGANCVDDSFENNDTVAMAATIGPGSQSSLGSCPADDDFYALPLTMGQTASIEIRFVHGEGNLDLEVYDPSGAKIVDSTSSSDNEAVTFTANASGDFVVRVFSVQDFGPTPGNQYAMVTTVSGGGGNPGQCPADMFEPNDSVSASTALAPGQYPTLNVCPNEDDYYVISLAAGESLTVDLTAIFIEGIVDGELLDASGNVVATTSGGLLSNTISYTAASAGPYYVHIFLTVDLGSAPGNNYSLIVSTQTGGGGPGGGMCTDDSFEENDTQATASPMPLGAQTGLAACGMDDDYYDFNLLAGDNVTFLVEFMNSEGDIDTELFSSSGTRVTGSASASDNESFDYEALSNGTYTLHVWLYGDAGSMPGNTYNLNVSYCDGDSYEPNNGLTTASTVAPGTYSNLRICTGQDDFYGVAASVGDSLDFTTNFTSAEGDIDLRLYDPSGTEVGSSAGVSDRENINHMATSSGTYVLQVFLYGDRGNFPGNDYELVITR